MPPQTSGLAFRTPNGRTVGQKKWPLSGSAPNTQTTWRQEGSIGWSTYETLYRTQIWVYVCVNKLARGIARLPLKAYTFDPDTGVRTEERTAPVAKLLKQPYPLGRTYHLIESAVSYLMIYGNSTFVKFRGGNGRTPAELWPLPWPQVEVILGTDRPIDGYRWTGRNGLRKFFVAEDVVHFKWFNADANQPFGVSPLEALATTLTMENAAQRYGISSFGNAARPASFIKSERNLTRQQRKELREEIEQNYGGPENAFKVALLDNGLDWKPLAFSASEAQLVDNRKFSRDEVCAAYDIPPPMIGILEHATYSNITQQHWMLYMDTLAPVLKMMEDTFMAQLVDGEPAWDGIFLEFDLDGVLRGNIEQRSQAYQRLLTSGVYTPNQLRKLENMPPINDPAADAVYVPINLDPVSAQMRKLQQEEADAAFERQQEVARQGAENRPPGETDPTNTPKPPPSPVPADNRQPKTERRLAEIERRLDESGL